jgi:hypothetical protein
MRGLRSEKIPKHCPRNTVLYLLFGVNLILILTEIPTKNANNRGKGQQTTSFDTNSSTTHKRNREY